MPDRYRPVPPDSYVTSGFGPRGPQFHYGTDYGRRGGSAGMEVLAAADGVVSRVGAASGFGGPDPAGWVVVDHDDGSSSVYGHVIREVEVGERVVGGQRIARVNPDLSTNGGVSPHLHFEVHPGRWAAGSQVDPVPWLASSPSSVRRSSSMPTVIDYAGGVPSAAAVKAAGHVGAVRYLSPPRPGSGLAGKPISRREVEDYEKHGLDLAFVWQYGKDPSDVMRGAVGGELDARSSDEALRALGRPGAPVFFAVDFDISLPQWNETAVEYFRAAVKVLGRERVGIYGHSRVVAWAKEDGVVADVGGGRVLGWVTNSWGSKDFGDYAVLFQRVVDTRSNPGPKVGGVTVDVNDILHDYWGQSAPASPVEDEAPVEDSAPPSVPDLVSTTSIEPNPGWRGDPTFLPDVLRAFGVEVVEFGGWRSRGQGDFDNIEYVMVHHTGSPTTPDPTPPSLIAFGHSALRGLLSQIHLGKTGVATIVGAGIAYHAGLSNSRYMPGYVYRQSNGRPERFTRGNAESIGIEVQNSGREPYPPEQMDALYRTVAAILWFLGYDSSRVIGHKEFGPGRKTDPAYDMDEFRVAVSRYLDRPPFMVEAVPVPAPPAEAVPAPAPTTPEEGGDMFTDEDRAMLREIYERETAQVRSTYVDPDGKRSEYRGDREDYILDDNRKIEDVHANMLPALWARVLLVERLLKDLVEAIERAGRNDGK